MAVLLHVRNHGIMGTTKASEHLYSDQTTVQSHLKMPSAHRYCNALISATYMRHSSYSYLAFLHTEMSRLRRGDRRVGNAEKCHMQGSSCSGACWWLALMSPLRLDLGRRQDSPLCPTSMIVIYPVPIPVRPCQFHLATRYTGL
jgi:hypothetical protein